ncbi:hypothetical protein [Bdellovibrio svalbardensis]|uniref:Uncharacterized protein n=1 Tax=Bdellovibrio svalbardensis TaxID=2972972 RepID=A0ABT6DKF0_9BACT|nr:hypothetical protein [Bdellovibrio svalbardensis]MDG0815583.1 hypothetical protein [Bdellovibrio svalbardensis]
MRLLRSILFLTLVLSAFISEAAPKTKTTLEPSPLTTQEDPFLKKKNLSFQDRIPTSQINVALGYAGGNFLENDQWAQGVLLSLRYSSLKGTDLLPTWDFQGELNKDNILGVFVGKRWYVSEDDYHPYVRLAAGSFFDASGELANFVQIKRWRLRASAGAGTKFTFEFGFGLAVTGPDLFGQFGYNFDF